MFKEIKENVLYIDGCNSVKLVEKYGSPLYVYSESDILARCKALKNDFLLRYKNTRVAYASKAFLNTYMCKLMEKEGMCIDVVSGGELYTAIKASFPAEHIEFNGNNKSREEIEMALNYGIGRFIVDSEVEIDFLEEICSDLDKKANVLYRINPGVKSEDTHDYNSTATKDAKFGIPLDQKILYSAIEKGIKSPHINLLGLHFHVGSQIFENQTHINAVKVALDITEKTYKTYNHAFTELNLGGGFGIKYVDSDLRKPYSYYLDPMMELIEKSAEMLGIDRPAVVIEPGRSIVGEAGSTLYKVGVIKEIPGIRKYVAIDGGMTDNIRPALYQAEYKAVIANRMDEEIKDVATICGKCCESGDILVKDALIAKPKKDDICAVYSTGAYGYSMASNYNKNVIPAVVFVKEGKASLVIKRQSYEQMIQNEQIKGFEEV